MRAAGWFLAGVAAASLLVACVAPLARAPERLIAAGGKAALPLEALPITAEVVPRGDKATLVLAVNWPPRDRQVAGIPPGTERVKFELEGNVPGGKPTIPEITRPVVGDVSSKPVSVEIPWSANLDLEIRATAFGTSAITAQSFWTKLELRRNAKVVVEIELFPAKGTESATAEILEPKIVNVAPDRGYVNSEITLSGLNFGYGKGPNSPSCSGCWVKFGGVIAGAPSLWSDGPSGAVIKIGVPPAATSGPISLRLGEDTPTMSSTWSPTPAPPGDPWGGRFSVLGPDGAAGPFLPFDNGAAGEIVDFRLAYARATDQWWVLYTRKASLTKGAGFQLVISPVSSASLQPGQGFPRVISSGPNILVDNTLVAGVQLGGLVPDPDANQVYVLWQESSGSASPSAVPVVYAGRVNNAGTLLRQNTPVSDSPAGTSAPALVMNASRTLLASWIDRRDSGGGTLRPRIYSRVLSAPVGADATFSAPSRAIQDTNTSGDVVPSAVGAPHAASDGTDFMVAWYEGLIDANSGNGAMTLFFQPVSASGAKVGGSASTQPASFPGRSAEEPQLVWSARGAEYLAVHVDRAGGIRGTASDIFLLRLSRVGIIQGSQTRVVENERTLGGRKQCPGTPCGQGSRSQPQIADNGRDYMVAFQFDRDDGETDILGARMQRYADNVLARAPEEGGTTSLAEILFSTASGGGERAGTQSSPRMAWGKDRLLVGWIESGALYLRAWR